MPRMLGMKAALHLIFRYVKISTKQDNLEWLFVIVGLEAELSCVFYWLNYLNGGNLIY